MAGVALAILAGIGLSLRGRGGPERLFEFQEDAVLAITPHRVFYREGKSVQIVDRDTGKPRGVAAFGDESVLAVASAGDDLLLATSPATGAIRRDPGDLRPQRPPVHVRRISAAGEEMIVPPVALPDCTGPPALTSGQCYWVTPGSAAAGRGTSRGDTEIRVRPLPAGPSRLVIGHAPPGAAVLSDGVFSYALLERKGGSRALIQLDGPESERILISDFHGESPPLRAGDRLFWLEPGPPGPLGQPYPWVHLRTANRNGTDAHTATDLPLASTLLLGPRNRIYFWGAPLNRHSPLMTLPDQGPPQYAGLTAETEAVLPRGYVEGRWLYYVEHLSRDRWWDWSSNGMYPQRYQALSRWRMPE